MQQRNSNADCAWCTLIGNDSGTEEDVGMTDDETVTRIRLLAAGLLEVSLDDLVVASTRQILAEEPDYLALSITESDLARQARRTLSLTLHRLAGLDIPDDLRPAAFETGQRRAIQGLALSSLLHSFRIDLRLLWEAIIQESRRRGILELQDILEHHTLLWDALEVNTADAVEAYQLVQQRRARRVDQHSREAFKQLLAVGEHDPRAVAAFASQMRLPPDAMYLVFALSGEEDPREALLVLDAYLQVQRRRCYVTVLEGLLCGLIVDPKGDLGAAAVPKGAKAAAALIRARGLASVPRAVRVAQRVASAARAGTVTDVGRDPLAVLAMLEPDLIDAVADERMGALGSLGDAEASRLRETLDALLRSDGTVADLAAISFRHRNTIRARLERIRQLTGIDNRVPADLALLALAAARRESRRPPGSS